VKPRHLILLLLWGAVALQCLYYYPLLHETVASHFDGAGQPNGWSSKSSFFGLYLFLVGVISFAFFALPRLLHRFPASLINIPHREYWLTAERKKPALEMLAEEMGWFGIFILLFMLTTIQLAINANLTASGLPADVMWMLLGAFFAFTGIWLVRLYRRFRIPS
jgi:uncharacterized membrane protein